MLPVAQGDWSVTVDPVKRWVIVTVLVRCPSCGVPGKLHHQVARTGWVSPAIQCPRKECGVANAIRLVGWTYGEVSLGKTH